MNKEIMKAAGFEEEVKRVESGKCPFCNKMVDLLEFRDEISKQEFLKLKELSDDSLPF